MKFCAEIEAYIKRNDQIFDNMIDQLHKKDILIEELSKKLNKGN